MDESEKPSNQEESQNQETTTTTTTTEETPAATNDGQSSDLLKSELDSLEKVVVEKLNSDETKATIESAIINPVVSLAQGFTQSAKEMVSKVEGKVGTWSSSLYKQSNGTEGGGSLPTSEEHVGDQEQAPRSIDENQPLVGVTPQTRTSWMNCCGLLEVFVKPKDQ